MTSPPEVIILTRQNQAFGQGHYKRMKLLNLRLESYGIQSAIMTKDWPVDSINDWRVMILDARDEAFPEKIYEQKKKTQYLIAVDNRGPGRSQSDIIWDTLPYPEMSPDELEKAVKNCILPPSITQEKNLSKDAVIKIIHSDELEKLKESIDLIHLPLEKREMIPENEFVQKLIQSDTVATYFGQTFFEALYLGKNIYLYGITDYHENLSNWFLNQWNHHPEIKSAFNGNGLDRLSTIVRSAICGVLDYPLG